MSSDKVSVTSGSLLSVSSSDPKCLWPEWSQTFVLKAKSAHQSSGAIFETLEEPCFTVPLPPKCVEVDSAKRQHRDFQARLAAFNASETAASNSADEADKSSGKKSSSRSTSQARAPVFDPDLLELIHYSQTMDYEMVKTEYTIEFTQRAKDRLAYKSKCVSMCADLMSGLSESSQSLVKRDDSYAALNASNDALGLWKLVQRLHLTPQVCADAQNALTKASFLQLKQNRLPYEKFEKIFSEQLATLNYLGTAPSEADLVAQFMMALSGPLVHHRTLVYQLQKVPLTLSAAMTEARAYLSIRGLLGNATGGGRDNQTDVANFGTQQQRHRNNQRGAKGGRGHGDSARRQSDGRGRGGGGDGHQKQSGRGGKGGEREWSEHYCTFCAKTKGQERWCRTHNTRDCRTKAASEEKDGNKKPSADSREKKSNGKSTTTNLGVADDSYDSDVSFMAIFAASSDSFSNESDTILQLNADVDALDISQPGVLTLDSGANKTVIRDEEILTDIRTIRPRTLNGIGGSVEVNQCGTIFPFGYGLFCRTASANLISVSAMTMAGAEMSLTHRHGRMVFLVTGRDNEVYEFRQNRQGLFVLLYTPRPVVPVPTFLNLDTTNIDAQRIVNQDVHFTPEQIARAKQILALHVHLSHPSDGALIKCLDSDSSRNMHLTGADVRNAGKIFGKICVSCAKGKMTRPSAPISLSPPECEIAESLCMDLMYIRDNKKRKVPHLVSVEPRTLHTQTLKLSAKTHAHLLHATAKIINEYKKHSFKVKTVISDRETVFGSLRSDLAGDGITLRQSSPEQHMSRVERRIRTLKEKCTATLADLPYKLPRSLLQFLVSFVVNSMNLVPNQQTGNRTPRELITGEKIDADAAFRAPFGAIAICKIPNQSSVRDLEPRSEIGIVVGRDLHSSGNVKIFRLHERDVVNRQKVVILPITADQLATINQIASEDIALDASEADLEWPFVSAEEDYATHPDALPVAVPDSVPAPAAPVASVPPPALEPRGVELPVPPAAVEHRGVDVPVSPAPADHRGDAVPVSVEPSATAISAAEDTPASPLWPQSGQQSLAAPIPVPPAAPAPTRDGLRPKGAPRQFFYSVMHISISKALRSHQTHAVSAMKSELQQMCKLNVWKLTHLKSVPREFAGKIIPSSMFFKEKFLPNGDFDKLKARLVASGNFQDLTLFDRKQNSSPTVSIPSLNLVVAVSVNQRWKRRAIDFTAAYLNANVTSPVYMRIGAQIVPTLVEVDPTAAEFVGSDGTIVVQLQKALYGLVESAKLWYDHLSAVLLSIGFVKCPSDNCVFILRGKTGRSICLVCVHVDDLFVTAKTDAILDTLVVTLQTKFYAISQQTGNVISYLGMEFTFDDDSGTVTIRQAGFLSDMLKKFKVTGKASTPATQDLFSADGTSPLSDTTPYRSMVMSTFYAAKRTRPDVLLSSAFLATRCSAPTASDLSKVQRVLMYLNATQHIPLVLKPDTLQIHASIDASFGTHPDSKGHTGVYISIGRYGGCVYAQSSKQRIVTKSSTESELVGLSDGLSQVMWTRSFMRDIGFLTPGPTPIMQDNQAAIRLAINGPGGKGRTKHIDNRYFYVSEKIANLEITLPWTPTGSMVSDAFTKPLTGTPFEDHRAEMLNTKSR